MDLVCDTVIDIVDDGVDERRMGTIAIPRNGADEVVPSIRVEAVPLVGRR